MRFTQAGLAWEESGNSDTLGCCDDATAPVTAAALTNAATPSEAPAVEAAATEAPAALPAECSAAQEELIALEDLLELNDIGVKVSWPANLDAPTVRMRVQRLNELIAAARSP